MWLQLCRVQKTRMILWVRWNWQAQKSSMRTHYSHNAMLEHPISTDLNSVPDAVVGHDLALLFILSYCHFYAMAMWNSELIFNQLPYWRISQRCRILPNLKNKAQSFCGVLCLHSIIFSVCPAPFILCSRASDSMFPVTPPHPFNCFFCSWAQDCPENLWRYL